LRSGGDRDKIERQNRPKPKKRVMVRSKAAPLAMLAIVGIVFLACDGGVFCPDEAPGPSIIVTVRDARNGKPAGSGCLGILTRSGFVDTLRAWETLEDGTTISLAAFARAGTYRVQILKEGYWGWQRDNVRVYQRECGLSTARLTASLESRE
jgi:hypothetical protein